MLINGTEIIEINECCEPQCCCSCNFYREVHKSCFYTINKKDGCICNESMGFSVCYLPKYVINRAAIMPLHGSTCEMYEKNKQGE